MAAAGGSLRGATTEARGGADRVLAKNGKAGPMQRRVDVQPARNEATSAESESNPVHVLVRVALGLTFPLVLMDHWMDHFFPSHLKSVVLVGGRLSREGINTKYESTPSGLKTT